MEVQRKGWGMWRDRDGDWKGVGKSKDEVRIDLGGMGEDRIQIERSAWEDRIERGIPMADFECRHGSLPGDPGIVCVCWSWIVPRGGDLVDELLLELDRVVEQGQGWLEQDQASSRPEGAIA